jgi:hypothetical protein
VFLEADHVVMRALGGGHDRIRILCRNHNQFAAETALGVDVMDRARRSAALAREVDAALRGLGFSAADARGAAHAAIDTLGPEAELEAVVAHALRHVAKPRGYSVSPAAGTPSRAGEPTASFGGSALNDWHCRYSAWMTGARSAVPSRTRPFRARRPVRDRRRRQRSPLRANVVHNHTGIP